MPFAPSFECPGSSAVIETTRLHGASSLALSITDTVRRIAGEPDGEIIFGETVPREELVRVQTPQGFRPEWLRKAHDAADKAGIPCNR